MNPSAAMIGKTAVQGSAAKWYLLATREVALTLAGIFSVCFLKYYEMYKEAFDAGIWTSADPGPWLGRAVVFKLEVNMHIDRLDGGPCASFPIGYFSGGEVYLPDLNAKLA